MILFGLPSKMLQAVRLNTLSRFCLRLFRTPLPFHWRMERLQWIQTLKNTTQGRLRKILFLFPLLIIWLFLTIFFAMVQKLLLISICLLACIPNFHCNRLVISLLWNIFIPFNESIRFFHQIFGIVNNFLTRMNIVPKVAKAEDTSFRLFVFYQKNSFLLISQIGRRLCIRKSGRFASNSINVHSSWS